MPKVKKSWTEKLHDSKDLPRVEPISESMRQRWGAGTVVIPAPLEVDALMRSVPYGKLTTINHIREALASQTQRYDRLSDHDRDFCLGGGACCHRGICWRRKGYHSILADLEKRRGTESEISRWSTGTASSLKRRRTYRRGF